MTALFSLLTTAFLLSAGAERQEHVIDGKTVRLEISRRQVPLWGEVRVTVTVEGPKPVEVEPLRYLTPSREWDEHGRGVEVTELPQGRQRWQQSFRLEPRAPTEPGKPMRLEVMPLKLPGGRVVQWQPISVEVTTSIGKADLDQARDVAPIEPSPPVPPAFPWLLPPVVLLAAFAGVTAVVFGLRRWRRAEPELSPKQRALRDLDRLAGLDPSDAEAGERGAVELAEILRSYVDDQFGLRSREQTTEEFLSSLAETPWPSEQHRQLADLLRRCDLAKFAGVTFTPEECQTAVAEARSFVQQTAGKKEPQMNTDGHR